MNNNVITALNQDSVKEYIDSVKKEDDVYEEIGFEVDNRNIHDPDYAYVYAGISDLMELVERYVRIGQNWYKLHKDDFQKAVCSNPVVMTVMEMDDAKVALVLAIAQAIRPSSTDYLAVRIAFLIANEGLNKFCNDYK